jgi:peptidyl-prolyl cis-trans isomerase SurA
MSLQRSLKNLSAMSALVMPAMMLMGAEAHAQTSKHKPKPVAAAAAAATSSSGPVASPAPKVRPPMGEGVAAIINNEIISSYDLRQRMRLLVATSGVQPTPENLPQIQREALRSLVDEHLQMQEVRDIEVKQKDLHLEPSDKDIDQTIGDMAKQSGVTREKLIETLRGDDVDTITLRDQIRARMSWERYIGARFRDNVEVGDTQVRAAYERANAAAEKPQYQVSEIFLDASRVGSQQAAEEGAQQLSSQLGQGASFQAVARQFSNLPTAANGGDQGWINADDLRPELLAALDQMKPGQVSRPIPVSDGVYLLALRDKRAGAVTEVVNLKQAELTLPATASAEQVSTAQGQLEALRRRITSCDSVDAQAAKSPGVVAADLGETEIKDLRPSFQTAIAHLKVGQVSEPVRTDAGLHLIVVCERHAGGARAVTRADIEDKLRGEQFDMFARRFLRDLRNSATIETR